MLSGKRQKFCDGIVSGLSAADAYRAAYPTANPSSAQKNASRLRAVLEVSAEIDRQRAEAEKLGGSSVLTHLEKRQWCARLVRADLAEGKVAGDLWAGCDLERKPQGVTIHKIRLADKIAAMKLDNDLSGDGAEAEVNKAITVVIKRNWQAA